MAAELNSPKDLSHGVSAKSPQGQTLSFERLDKSSSSTLKVRRCVNKINREDRMFLLNSFRPSPMRLITANCNYTALQHQENVYLPRNLSIPGRGKRFFPFPQCGDWLWGPPSVLYGGYRGSFPGSKAVGAW